MEKYSYIKKELFSYEFFTLLDFDNEARKRLDKGELASPIPNSSLVPIQVVGPQRQTQRFWFRVLLNLMVR